MQNITTSEIHKSFFHKKKLQYFFYINKMEIMNIKNDNIYTNM